MSGILTVAQLEFRLRIRAGRWRWLVGAWFLALAGITWLVRNAARQPNLVGPEATGEKTLGAVMFGVVVLVVLALALLVAPALAAQSVNGDRERGTLATLQVTRLRASEIALGKLAASWGTALVFLALTLPLALWCYAEGGLSLVRVAGVYLVTALLLGVVCAISLGLSALLARSTTSGVLAYLTVFALSAGTAILFALVTETTQQQVTAISRSCDERGGNCVDTAYDTTWWLVAPNPFAVLADSAPAGPVNRIRLPNGDVMEEPASVDVLGGLSRELHKIRARPAAQQNEFGTSYGVPDGVTGGPVWPLGLGIDLALAVGALWVATVRLRTPTARLARGQRIA